MNKKYVILVKDKNNKIFYFEGISQTSIYPPMATFSPKIRHASLFHSIVEADKAWKRYLESSLSSPEYWKYVAIEEVKN